MKHFPLSTEQFPKCCPYNKIPEWMEHRRKGFIFNELVVQRGPTPFSLPDELRRMIVQPLFAKQPEQDKASVLRGKRYHGEYNRFYNFGNGDPGYQTAYRLPRLADYGNKKRKLTSLSYEDSHERIFIADGPLSGFVCSFGWCVEGTVIPISDPDLPIAYGSLEDTEGGVDYIQSEERVNMCCTIRVSKLNKIIINYFGYEYAPKSNEFYTSRRVKRSQTEIWDFSAESSQEATRQIIFDNGFTVKCTRQ